MNEINNENKIRSGRNSFNMSLPRKKNPGHGTNLIREN